MNFIIHRTFSSLRRCVRLVFLHATPLREVYMFHATPPSRNVMFLKTFINHHILLSLRRRAVA